MVPQIYQEAIKKIIDQLILITSNDLEYMSKVTNSFNPQILEKKINFFKNIDIYTNFVFDSNISSILNDKTVSD
jgi:hypothetical protein